jgi:hypothetical protein
MCPENFLGTMSVHLESMRRRTLVSTIKYERKNADQIGVVVRKRSDHNEAVKRRSSDHTRAVVNKISGPHWQQWAKPSRHT